MFNPLPGFGCPLPNPFRPPVLCEISVANPNNETANNIIEHPADGTKPLTTVAPGELITTLFERKKYRKHSCRNHWGCHRTSLSYPLEY